MSIEDGIRWLFPKCIEIQKNEIKVLKNVKDDVKLIFYLYLSSKAFFCKLFLAETEPFACSWLCHILNNINVYFLCLDNLNFRLHFLC